MSAYNVSDNHINYLVSAAHILKAHVYHGNHGKYELKTQDQCQYMAERLRVENQNSIIHRYGEPDPLDPIVFQFHGAARLRDLAQIGKAAHCYEYQACEVEDYETTLAATFVKALYSAIIDALPGYEDSAWGAPEFVEDNEFDPPCLSDVDKPEPGKIYRLM